MRKCQIKKKRLSSRLTLLIVILLVLTLMSIGCGENEAVTIEEEREKITLEEIEEYFRDGGAASPDDVIRDHMQAFNDDDAEAYMSCFQPAYLLEMLEDSESTPKPRDMESFVRSMHIGLMFFDESFVDVELEVTYISDEEATVTVSNGRWMWGDEVFWDFAEKPGDFEVVMEEGRWYIKGEAYIGGITL